MEAPTPAPADPNDPGWVVEALYFTPACDDPDSEIAGLKYESGPFLTRESAEEFLLALAGHSSRFRRATVRRNVPEALFPRFRNLN